MKQRTTVSSIDRVARLRLPERAAIAGGRCVREADRLLLSTAVNGFLDTTHFDTVRFPPPPWAAELFRAAANDGTLAYTGYRGHPGVLEGVAEALTNFVGIAVDPKENIILTPGTQAGLFSALSAIVAEGSRVAHIEPDYLFSARILRFLGAVVGYVPLKLSEGTQTQPDLDALEQEFRNKSAKTLVFSHPNNPTGAVFSAETIKKVAQLCIQYDVTVVADELYARLLHDGVRFPHIAAEPGMSDRTITLLGPSKTESLSGYRLGVAIGPAHLLDDIEDVISITSLRAPAYAQHVLLRWLRSDCDWLSKRLADFSALREMTFAAFAQLPWVKAKKQSGTAYAWPDVSALEVEGDIVGDEMMRKAGILVSPGYQFGPTSGGNFRICYAREEGEWSAALERMIGVLKNLHG